MNSFRDFISEIDRLKERARYYGEPPTLETLEEIELEAHALDAEFSNSYSDEEFHEMLRENEDLKERISELENELAIALSKKRRKKDPFKGVSPEYARSNWKVIQGTGESFPL